MVKAVIPIRKGSIRVTNKNTKIFGDTTLLGLKIDNLKKVKNIDEIIVNTDSNEAIEIAKIKGVSYHVREKYFASSECTTPEFMVHLAEVTDTDIIAYCPCTSPFVKSSTIEECINLYNGNFLKFDSVATVKVIREFMWKNGEPLNYQRDKTPNSQDFNDIFALTFGACIISKSDLLKNKYVVGQKPYFVETSHLEGIDIDTPLDFFIAEQIYANSFHL